MSQLRRQQSMPASRSANIKDKKPQEPLRKSGNTSIGKLTLLYQPRIVRATKPKSLNGPFDIYDVPYIRNVIGSYHNSDRERKINDIRTSNQFFDDLNLDNYFLKRSNWVNRSKFINTYGLYSAATVYLPSLNKKVDSQSNRYRSACPSLTSVSSNFTTSYELRNTTNLS